MFAKLERLRKKVVARKRLLKKWYGTKRKEIPRVINEIIKFDII